MIVIVINTCMSLIIISAMIYTVVFSIKKSKFPFHIAIQIIILLIFLLIAVSNILERIYDVHEIDRIEEYLEICLAPFILLYIYSLITIREKEKLLMKETKLKKVLAQRDELIREIHHRVKNNIQFVASLLRLEFNDIPDVDIQNRIKITSQRIHIMSGVYETLLSSENIIEVDAGKFLTNIIYMGIIQNKTENVNSIPEIIVDNIMLSIEQAHSLGLCLLEILNNCGFDRVEEKKPKICFIKTKDSYRLTIKDCLLDFIENQKDSLSLFIFHSMLKQLSAQHSFSKDEDELLITFKIYN